MLSKGLCMLHGCRVDAGALAPVFDVEYFCGVCLDLEMSSANSHEDTYLCVEVEWTFAHQHTCTNMHVFSLQDSWNLLHLISAAVLNSRRTFIPAASAETSVDASLYWLVCCPQAERCRGKALESNSNLNRFFKFLHQCDEAIFQILWSIQVPCQLQ